MSNRKYSRLGKLILKQDVRRDLDGVFQLIETGGNVVPLINIAALTSVDDTLLVSGAPIRVQTVRDYFTLDKTDITPPDGITVVATKSGIGRWNRVLSSDQHWARQSNWFIDPVSGNDELDGSLRITALKTWAEMVRRITLIPIIERTITTITVLNTLPVTDTARLYPSVGLEGFLHITGVKTLLHTGSFTAITARSPAANQPLEMTDSSLPSSGAWTTYLGKLTQITASTTPSNVGASTWVAKDLGSKKARFGSPTTVDPSLSTNEIVPTVGDSYAIYDVTKIGSIDIKPINGSVDFDFTGGIPIPLHGSILIEYLDFETGWTGAGEFDSAVLGGDEQIYFNNCRWSTQGELTIIGNGALLSNCYTGSSTTLNINSGAVVNLFAGVHCGGSLVSGGLVIRAGTLFQGAGIQGNISASAFLAITDCGVMDWTDEAFDVSYGSNAIMFAPSKLWGSSTVVNSYSFRVAWAAGKFCYDGSVGISGLTIVGMKLGGTADFKIGAFVTGPAIDPTTFVYTAARAYTLALLKTSVAGGGFGGAVIDPRYGGGICPAF